MEADKQRVHCSAFHGQGSGAQVDEYVQSRLDAHVIKSSGRHKTPLTRPPTHQPTNQPIHPPTSPT